MDILEKETLFNPCYMGVMAKSNCPMTPDVHLPGDRG
jgi:hypothetical protein